MEKCKIIAIANQKGGIISNLNNNFQKDENGRFTGSIKNSR